MAYAVYGAVYLVGAIAELDPSRRVTFFGFVPWWAFYVAGGLLLFSLPPLVWRGWRKVTFALAFFTGAKALWLSFLQGRRLSRGDPVRGYDLLFAVVAVVACALLQRAALRDSRRRG